ncbi:MAG: DUF4190 domain-containing protein, partial [Planctomycetota bacterium]
VDVRLDKVVLKSLAHEPERRYQHASEVKTEVETITHVAPPPKSAPAVVELPASKTSRLAIASLVLAILSPFTCYITAIPAIIMGIVVLVKIPQSRGQLKGTGLAISAVDAAPRQGQTNCLPKCLRGQHVTPRQVYAYLCQRLR